MISGIYLIQCLVNGKSYVGQSKTINRRIDAHKNLLKNNNHKNKYLQNAWNKYGENNFVFSICTFCSVDDLDNYEKFYILLLSGFEYGYNLETGGNTNKNISAISKQKMSIAKKGKPSLLKGRKASNELKLKLSIAHKGLPSPKKGIKTGKPAWNSGKKGLQISHKRIKVEVFDNIANKNLGIFDSKAHFKESINYKSKNYIKLSKTETKLGKYLLKSI